MSFSKEARLQNIADAILLLMENTHGQSFMGTFIDERSVDARILPTTWSELKTRYLVRETNCRWTYTLSGRGWILGLKLLGQFDTEQMKAKAGKLAGALKDRAKGRQYDNFAGVEEIAAETGLSDDFVRDAIESDLFGELFGRKGAEWAGPYDRGRTIRIPNDFGLEHL